MGFSVVGRRRSRDAGLWSRRARWRRVGNRRGGAHARWRRGLGPSQVWPHDRQPALGPGRLRGRLRAHCVADLRARSVLGAPRRRRKLRHRHVVRVPRPSAGSDRGIRRRLLSASPMQRRFFPAGATTASDAPDEVTSVAVAITMPAAPHLPAGDPQPARAWSSAGCTSEARGGHEGDAAAARVGNPAGRHLAADAVRGRADGVRSALPDGQAPELLEGSESRRSADEAIAVIAARANQRPSPLTLVVTFQMGGAINRSVRPTPPTPSARRPGCRRSTATGRTRPITRPISPGFGRASI